MVNEDTKTSHNDLKDIPGTGSATLEFRFSAFDEIVICIIPVFLGRVLELYQDWNFSEIPVSELNGAQETNFGIWR